MSTRDLSFTVSRYFFRFYLFREKYSDTLKKIVAVYLNESERNQNILGQSCYFFLHFFTIVAKFVFLK